MFKVLLSGAAVLALASAAQATDIVVKSVGVESSNYTATISGTGFKSVTAVDSAILLTTTSGAVIPVFCIDVYHEISTGAQNPNITFNQGAFLTDSSGSLSGTGTNLSTAQISEISSLADLGTGLYKEKVSGLSLDLAGIQGAIWTIENPTLKVTADAQVDASIAKYVTYAGDHPATANLALYDVAGTAQGEMPGVPEPAGWALMLIGLGAMGGALRAARRGKVAAI